MKLRTVLFDFDGTLANTLPLTIHGMQYVFKTFDERTIRDDEVIAMFGPPEDGMISENFRHKDRIAEAIDCYFSIYTKEHQDYVENNSDILKLLQELKEQHIPVGVITGKSRRSYLLSEKALGFQGLFSHVITGDEAAAPKPDPQGILQTLELFQADPASSIYIGDSNIDVLAGKAAGIHTAAVQWLPMSQSSDFPAAPDYYWTDVNPFIALLKKQRS
ncbi:MAG: HAD family hydrolase [Sporolactobacillus sp.]